MTLEISSRESSSVGAVHESRGEARPGGDRRSWLRGAGPWQLAAGLFFLFVAGVIASADLQRPWPILNWVVYLPGRDFTGHLILIGGLGFLVNGALGARPARLPGPLLGTWIVGVSILAEEISQIWLPSRSFSISDLVGNALGLALADLVWRWLRRRAGATSSEPIWAEDRASRA